MAEYDHVVIGGGINGSWTAYHLSKSGYKTLLIEQFPMPHSRGSSHGQSRGIRRAYPERILTEMMDDAYTQWHQLEDDTSEKLLKTTGLLVMADEENAVLKDTIASFRATPNSQFDVLSPSQMKLRYPNLTMGPNVGACMDPNAGIVMADKALKLVWEMIKKSGGIIVDACPVKEIIPRQDSVKIVCDKDREFSAKSVVICAGPWTNRLTEPIGWKLPVNPIKIPVYYFRAFDHIPHTFIWEDDKKHIWGLPELEYPGLVKICLHTGPDIDPDQRDDVDIAAEEETLTNFITASFTGVHPKPSIIESCIYTVSPDGVHILDKHPRFSNVIVGCGFSGTGFKLGPVTGEFLANLATGKRPKYDTRPFKADRFNKGSRL